jgi:hypothetical protein
MALLRIERRAFPPRTDKFICTDCGLVERIARPRDAVRPSYPLALDTRVHRWQTKEGLRLIGLAFGTITAAVMMIAAMVVMSIHRGASEWPALTIAAAFATDLESAR